MLDCGGEIVAGLLVVGFDIEIADDLLVVGFGIEFVTALLVVWCKPGWDTL